jgi:ribose-phosphate pyrophosphokinase
MIISSINSETLSKRVAGVLGESLSIPEVRTFADGESYVRLRKPVSGEAVFIISSLFPNPDKRLVETLLMCDSARRGGAKSISVVLPYFAYARQDRAALAGEAISAGVVGSALRAAGAGRIVTVEAHSNLALRELAGGHGGVRDVETTEPVGKAVSDLVGRVDFIAAPDAGVLEKAKAVAKIVGVEVCAFSKKRDHRTGEISTVLNGRPDIKGARFVFIDDMISTGSTLAKAAAILKRRGAREISAVCVHALMVGDAKALLYNSGIRKVYGSDTVQNAYSGYSVAREIADVL